MPKGGVGKSISQQMRDSLCDTNEFFDLLQNLSQGDFTASDYRKQLLGAIVVGHTDAFLCDVDTTSQCDNCGCIRLDLPKMLTCGGCRGYHYCSKDCQKKNWKDVHQKMCTKGSMFSRGHFRVTDVCVKAVTTLSMYTDPSTIPVFNSKHSFFHKKVLESGFKDANYVALYSRKAQGLCYVPMPDKVSRMIKNIKPGGEFTEATNSFIQVLVPTKTPGPDGNMRLFFMIKETFVKLPWLDNIPHPIAPRKC